MGTIGIDPRRSPTRFLIRWDGGFRTIGFERISFLSAACHERSDHLPRRTVCDGSVKIRSRLHDPLFRFNPKPHPGGSLSPRRALC